MTNNRRWVGRAVSRAWPVVILALLPFVVLWRLWTRNPLDRAFIWQDVTDTVYPFFVFLNDCITRYHEIPHWAWGIYSGTPFSATFFDFLLYPLNLIFFLGALDPARPGVFHAFMLAHLSIAGIGFFLLARSFLVRRLIAFLGASLYVFAGFTMYILIVGPAWSIGHAWLPAALFCLRKFVLHEKPLWCMAFSASMFLMISSLMPLLLIPIMYFTVVFFAVSVSVEGKARRWLPLTMWFLAAVLLGFLLHSVEIFPIVEASLVEQAFRRSSYLYARDKWMEQTVERFLRDYFLGGDISLPYLSAAGGLAVIFSFWLRRGRYWVLWASVFVVSVAGFLWSRDFGLYDLFYRFVPGIKLLPAVERGGIGLVYTLSASFLVMATLASIGRLRRSHFLWAVPAVIAVVVWSVYKPAEQAQLVAFRRSFAAWFAAVALLLLFVSASRGPRRRASLVFASVLFVVGTASILSRTFENRLTPVTDASLPPLHPAAAGSAAEVLSESPYLRGRSKTQKLPSINGPRRNRNRDNVALLQGADNVAGYYQFLPARAAQAFSAAGFVDNYLFRGPLPEGFESQLRWPAATVTKLYALAGSPRGRAWLVPASVVTRDPPLQAMTAPNFDPYTTCFLEPEWSVMTQEFSGRYVKIFRSLQRLTRNDRPIPPSLLSLPINSDVMLIRQTPNSAAFRLLRETHGEILLFSDTWYPGWAAYLNGKRIPLFVADYTFKGVALRAPQNSVVEFVFEPPIVKLGAVVSVLSLLLFAALCVIGWKRAAAEIEASDSASSDVSEPTLQPS